MEIVGWDSFDVVKFVNSGKQVHLKSAKQDLVKIAMPEILVFNEVNCICIFQEHERSDLLNQYRTLSVEAERYETATHQLESEGSNLRLELMTRDNEIRRQREKLEAYDREIQDVSVVIGKRIMWLCGEIQGAYLVI